MLSQTNLYLLRNNAYRKYLYFLHNCKINNNVQYLDLARCFDSIMEELLESEQRI